MNGGSEAGVSEDSVEINLQSIRKRERDLRRKYPTCSHCGAVVREGKDMYSRADAALRDEWFVPDYLRPQPKDSGQ